MTTATFPDIEGDPVEVNLPPADGRAAAAASRPVALSTEDKTALDALATQATAAAILAKIIAAPSTEAKQDTIITRLTDIETAVELLDNAVSGSELQVDVVGALPAGTAVLGKVGIDPEDDVTLLTAAAATGSSQAVTAGRYNWVAYGTWDGATAQLQWSPNSGTTWIDVQSASVTEDGGFLDVPLGAGHARVTIAGAGGSTSVSSKLSGVA